VHHLLVVAGGRLWCGSASNFNPVSASNVDPHPMKYWAFTDLGVGLNMPMVG